MGGFVTADVSKGGGIEMLMDADVGEGGVKNQPKSADVVYGRPLWQNLIRFARFDNIRQDLIGLNSTVLD